MFAKSMTTYDMCLLSHQAVADRVTEIGLPAWLSCSRPCHPPDPFIFCGDRAGHPRGCMRCLTACTFLALALTLIPSCCLSATLSVISCLDQGWWGVAFTIIALSPQTKGPFWCFYQLPGASIQLYVWLPEKWAPGMSTDPADSL